MENFAKINNLFKELYDELGVVLSDLKHDINYSASHPELIHRVEMVEEALQENETQLTAIKDDWEELENNFESQGFRDEDDDDRETRMFSPDQDED